MEEQFNTFVAQYPNLNRYVQQYGRIRSIDEHFKVFFTAKHMKDTMHSFVVFTPPNANNEIEIKSITLNVSTGIETIIILLFNYVKDSEMKLTARMNNNDIFLKVTSTYNGNKKDPKGNGPFGIEITGGRYVTVIGDDPQIILSNFGIEIEKLQQVKTREQIFNECCCMDSIHDSYITKADFNNIFEQIFIRFEELLTVTKEFYDSITDHGYIQPPFTGNLFPSLAYLKTPEQ